MIYQLRRRGRRLTSASAPTLSTIERETSKPVVSVSVKAYPPAFRSGGPVRSVEALVGMLHEEIDFRVITSLDDNGYDLGSEGIPAVSWSQRSNALVSALPRGATAPLRIAWQIRSTHPDVLYINSLFDPGFSLVPLLARRVGLLKPGRTIVAPRGELDPGALALKRPRKRMVVKLLRLLGLTNGLVWHATNDEEAQRIADTFGVHSEIAVASNLRSLKVADATLPPPNGATRIVFMSKIDRKKNLETAIEAVALHPFATLTVIGPVKDEAYWAELQECVKASGLNERFNYAGPVEPDQMIQRLRDFDLFLLPTRGENFGHAILEALAAGLPVLLGENTPWSRVEAMGAGWVCPADLPKTFARCIQAYEELSDEDRMAMRRAAAQIAEDHVSDPNPLEAHRQMLLPELRVP